jgi:hypothetical protein
MLPLTVVLAVTSWAGLGLFTVGRRKIPKLRFLEEKGATPLTH